MHRRPAISKTTRDGKALRIVLSFLLATALGPMLFVQFSSRIFSNDGFSSRSADDRRSISSPLLTYRYPLVAIAPQRNDTPLALEITHRPITLTPHRYTFLLNSPHACTIDPKTKQQQQRQQMSKQSSGHILLLIYVLSPMSHFSERARIRGTWGSVRSFSGVQIRLVFIITQFNFTRLEQLNYESSHFHDLVLEDRGQSGLKITEAKAKILKEGGHEGLLALSWVVEYCPEADYVMKTVDESFVNIYTVAWHLSNLYKTSYRHRVLTCSVSEKEFSFLSVAGENLSTSNNITSRLKYCYYLAYVYSIDVARALYQVSAYVNHTNTSPDLYITGILPNHVNNQQLLSSSSKRETESSNGNSDGNSDYYDAPYNHDQEKPTILEHSPMNRAFFNPSNMPAFKYPTEWYKYAFTLFKPMVNSIYVEGWRDCSINMEAGNFPSGIPEGFLPGMLSDDYVDLRRLTDPKLM